MSYKKKIKLTANRFIGSEYFKLEEKELNNIVSIQQSFFKLKKISAFIFGNAVFITFISYMIKVSVVVTKFHELIETGCQNRGLKTILYNVNFVFSSKH